MVQINIEAGVKEYQLPKNVDWAKEHIDRIVLLAPSVSIISPIDGVTPVMTRAKLQNMYMDIYAGDDSEIALNLAAENIMYTNNHPVEIDNTISLNLSRLTFMDEPEQDACILMYVCYGGSVVDDYEPSKQSVTINFNLGAGERLSFRDAINTYIHAPGEKVRGIAVWDPEQNPVYLTLRDHQLSYVIRSMYGGMCRPEMLGMTAEQTQIHPLYLDSVDIDFDYSFVQNATNTPHEQTITLYY